MFDSINQRPHSWRSYLFHCFLGIVLTPSLGVGDYRLAPIAGGLAAWFSARWVSSRTAAYVWVPAAALFIYAAVGLLRSWSPAWSSMGRWEYIANTMFGPNCSESECLYTIFTAALTGGIAYSLVGWLSWRHRSRKAVSD